ncbi:LysR family transcriptional regulator [Paralimibaculum aggregatum]|uniref:LysR family transcriptional regulator n=1 Tax=Paralimibaculum aggregatum TaxID=3036245 RepID=A0ABQ6LL78_9RHOB|nr:LysR family transcriptional regulator [Limibaculum sp. NKW23]GMG81563.1 LysR family transcriptional regulator [Limibaculum sp. NKW23]
MDRLGAMEVLLAAVEAGSLSAAGRRLGIPLATVSRRVADLEAHLGSRLLIRSTRRLTLTEAGTAYVEAARRILEAVGEAERMAAGEYSTPRGELLVAAPVVFGRLHVLPVIGAFLAQFPEIDVRLMLSDRNSHLTDEHIDVAVRIGRLPDSAVRATRVGEVCRIACASPAYLAARGRPQVPADLARLTCVTFDVLGAPGEWRFPGLGGGREAAVAIRSRLSVNTAEAAVDAALAGVGVTRVLSYQAAAHLEAGRLERVLVAYEPEPMPVSVLHAGQGLLPRKTRSFIDFAVPRLRAELARLAAAG